MPTTPPDQEELPIIQPTAEELTDNPTPEVEFFESADDYRCFSDDKREWSDPADQQ